MRAMTLTARVLRRGRLPSMDRRAPMMWMVRPRLLPLRSRGPEQGSSPVVLPPKNRQLPPQVGRLSHRRLPSRPLPQLYLLPPPLPQPPPPPLPQPPPPPPPPPPPRAAPPPAAAAPPTPAAAAAVAPAPAAAVPPARTPDESVVAPAAATPAAPDKPITPVVPPAPPARAPP